MAHLLYGEDDLSIEEALDVFKADVGPEELRDVNITVLDGAQTTFGEVTATCSTVPFLSEKRLVIVRGLLSKFERGRPSRRPRRSDSPSGNDGRLAEWAGLAEFIRSVPDSTELVFVDKSLRSSNPLLTKIRSLVDVKTFPLPSGGGLRQWIQTRSAKYDLSLDNGAVSSLAETIGPDVRVMDQELQKLSLYANGRTLTQADVEEMVSYVREASIFVAVDAVLEGRAGAAMRSVHQILDAGQPATYVITMIARQLRLLMLAKDLRALRVPQGEMGKRLSISGYPLQKTLEQERRFSMARLTDIHRMLLEADLSLKSTGVDDQLILDMLIADLASTGTTARC